MTIISKSTWGFEGTGMPMSSWNKLEIAAANSAGFKAGRCRDSALCIAYGYNGHPFVRAIRELVVLWFKLLIPLVNSHDPFLVDLEGAWQTAKITIDTTNPHEHCLVDPATIPTFANSMQKKWHHESSHCLLSLLRLTSQHSLRLDRQYRGKVVSYSM